MLIENVNHSLNAGKKCVKGLFCLCLTYSVYIPLLNAVSNKFIYGFSFAKNKG